MKIKIGAFNYDLQEVPAVINKEGVECFGICRQVQLAISDLKWRMPDNYILNRLHSKKEDKK